MRRDERPASLGVSERRESLAEYIRRVRAEKELSTPQVAKRSGDQISAPYIWRIEQGLMQNVSQKKLRALAKGLDVLEEELIAVARGPAPSSTPDQRPARMLGFFSDSPPHAQEYMDLFCEAVWRHEKRKRRRGRQTLTSPEPTQD